MVTSSRDALDWAAQQETPILTVDDIEAGPVGEHHTRFRLGSWRKLVKRVDPQTVGKETDVADSACVVTSR